jgi:hypothetical protein
MIAPPHMDSSSNLEGERFLVECLREDSIEVEWKLGESAGACFLRTLDLVRWYETTDGVFIQLRVVGAEGPVTFGWVRLAGTRSARLVPPSWNPN